MDEAPDPIAPPTPPEPAHITAARQAQQAVADAVANTASATRTGTSQN